MHLQLAIFTGLYTRFILGRENVNSVMFKFLISSKRYLPCIYTLPSHNLKYNLLVLLPFLTVDWQFWVNLVKLGFTYRCLFFKLGFPTSPPFNAFVTISYIIYIWVFFPKPWRITGLQGKGEGISLNSRYHFHPLHWYLDIDWVINAESSCPHVAGLELGALGLQLQVANH